MTVIDWAGKVMTVRGPVAAAELGVTLSHDHLLSDGWGIRKLYEAIVDDEDIAVEEARHYAAAGGKSICDPTNICELGQLVAYGGPGYANVIENFLPMLRERAVGEADIHQMTVTNPARAFAFTDLGERTS
jgi:predicted metal-dependent phosphotriesterase family hydrolase